MSYHIVTSRFSIPHSMMGSHKVVKTFDMNGFAVNYDLYSERVTLLI